ncbi:hypothetical protein Sjap_003693 [Stephania japonica]|uniref:Uncharacterized protein n=1 Tax=Stephania japonica TaxID=461633 RepID=A0AAP0KQV8_9MAGN
MQLCMVEKATHSFLIYQNQNCCSLLFSVIILTPFELSVSCAMQHLDMNAAF